MWGTPEDTDSKEVGILIACCAAPCSAVLAPFDARGDSCFTNLEGPPVNPTDVGRAAACRSCAAQQTIAIQEVEVACFDEFICFFL
jgi:hypothetical protein